MTSGSRTLGLVTALVALCGGGGVVSGHSIDRELVRAGIERHRGEVRACYERALATEPSLTMRLMLELTIGKDGAVTAARVEPAADTPPSAGVSAVGDCIAEAARRWRFPGSAWIEVVKVRYPYVFKTDERATKGAAPAVSGGGGGVLGARVGEKLLEGRLAEVGRCYDAGLRLDASLQLELTLSLTVGRLGDRAEVLDVSVDAPAGPLPTASAAEGVRSCVRGVARLWQWTLAELAAARDGGGGGSPTGAVGDRSGVVRIVYPLRFGPPQAPRDGPRDGARDEKAAKPDAKLDEKR